LVFEKLVKGRSELGEVWLDSARVRRRLILCSSLKHTKRLTGWALSPTVTAHRRRAILARLHPSVNMVLLHRYRHPHYPNFLRSFLRHRNLPLSPLPLHYRQLLYPPLRLSLSPQTLHCRFSFLFARTAGRFRRIDRLRDEGRFAASFETSANSRRGRTGEGRREKRHGVGVCGDGTELLALVEAVECERARPP
jgi:hypothetical protein